jgi:DNA-binding NarL/FixJ family response regulator
VLLLSDVRLYREGLAQALARLPRMDVVGTSTVGDVITALRELRPQVVLLDIAKRQSLLAVSAIHGAAPDVRVVAFAVADADDEVVACAEAGVAGCVPWDASIGDVAGVVESAARGEAACPPRMIATLFRRLAALAADRGNALSPRLGLTGRERQIVELVDRGLSNKEIARCLCIELATVKNHVHNVLEKLHVSSRGEAAARVRGRAS